MKDCEVYLVVRREQQFDDEGCSYNLQPLGIFTQRDIAQRFADRDDSREVHVIKVDALADLVSADLKVYHVTVTKGDHRWPPQCWARVVDDNTLRGAWFKQEEGASHPYLHIVIAAVNGDDAVALGERTRKVAVQLSVWPDLLPVGQIEWLRQIVIPSECPAAEIAFALESVIRREARQDERS